MANTYLTRSMGTPTNRKKFTISVWIKKCLVASSGSQHIWDGYYSVDNRLVIYFQASATDTFAMYNVAGGSASMYMNTNQKFRDINGWYHIYIGVDTTQSTAADRIKMYINGEQVTSWETSNYPSQNADLTFANGYTNYIGRYGGGSNFFDGIMSHFYYVDGSVIDIAQFGSTDATTGEWKINTNPTISSYGNEGFLILKDGNTITDQSPNSNDFTSNGAGVTKTEDSPSNVFATMNPVDSYWMSTTYTNGNNKAVTQGSHRTSMAATLGASSGKFYYEVKFDAETSSAGLVVGIDTKGASSCSVFNGSYCDEYTGRRTYGYGYYSSDGVVYNSGSNVGSYTSFSTGTIICVAVDLDNNKLYFRRNDNAWENSGDPTSGSTGTGAISITAASSTDTGFYFPALSDGSNSGTATFSTNFGNGYFGTTAVSSAGTNASNIGIFEYDVPTGYTAWSTKGLNL